jgi:hypothetical protein
MQVFSTLSWLAQQAKNASGVDQNHQLSFINNQLLF